MSEQREVVAPDGDDLLAARATAVGIGLIALMVSWLIANRITALFWDAPAGPILAMSLALASGFVAGAVGYRKLITPRT